MGDSIRLEELLTLEKQIGASFVLVMSSDVIHSLRFLIIAVEILTVSVLLLITASILIICFSFCSHNVAILL